MVIYLIRLQVQFIDDNMLNDLLKYDLRNGINSIVENDIRRSWLPWKGKQLGIFTLLQQKYKGDGSEESPLIIDWLDYDPENPKKWSSLYKWFISLIISSATIGVTFVSSAYVGSFNEIRDELHASDEVVILGLSLYALAFAITPLFWAPFSEIFGRRPLFIVTYGSLTAFNAGAVASQNIWTLLILRFFAGAFAASSLANAGGVLADLFVASQRGIPLSFFALTTFVGIILGPMVGGFVGETVGWRWVEGVMAIFTGIIWIIICFLLPETYSPVLLHKRAKTLSRMRGIVYRSKFEEKEVKKLGKLFQISLSRPWYLLFREPIVLLLSIYMAIIFGTLHMFFDAFPIVYQEKRKWSEGIGGLAFIGLLVGVILAFIYTILDDLRYNYAAKNSEGHSAPPETRLPPAMVGSICLPVALFWFAWTDSPSIHWIVSIIASAPFGFGMFAIFVAVLNYLIDAYTIYAASVLAANMVLRYIFAAVFPLFTTQMYDKLGIHWATCIPAFFTLICVPFPFLFHKYGATIRTKCKYAAEAQEMK
jgi:multidrug resistance protein